MNDDRTIFETFGRLRPEGGDVFADTLLPGVTWYDAIAGVIAQGKVPENIKYGHLMAYAIAKIGVPPVANP